jgi:hypothetical protein
LGSEQKSWLDCFDASYSSCKPVVDETENRDQHPGVYLGPSKAVLLRGYLRLAWICLVPKFRFRGLLEPIENSIDSFQTNWPEKAIQSKGLP